MIYLLWPTIRPHVFNGAHKKWINAADNNKNIKIIVAANNIEDAQIVKKSLRNSDEVIILNTAKRGVCYPSYVLSSKLEANNDDIVILASDDFTAPDHFDTYLINKLKGRDSLLMVRDGYQKPDSSNMRDPVITIPIMTFGALLKLNKIIYHTAYSHMCSDAELYLNAKELGLLIDDRLTDTTTFTHLHWAAGLRQPDQNDVAYNNNWAADEATWSKRKLMSVQERLKI